MPCLVALSTHWAMKANSTWNRFFQITKPCLCVKCQIWVTKVKKKKKKIKPSEKVAHHLRGSCNALATDFCSIPSCCDLTVSNKLHY